MNNLNANANISFVMLGKHKYAMDLLNPIEAIAWGNQALSLFGPSLGKIFESIDFKSMEDIDLDKQGLAGLANKLQAIIAKTLASCGELKSDEVSKMMNEAIKRCYTPQNEPLGDEAVFNRWFREHPGDLYPLGCMALVHLVKVFFPKQLVTSASDFLSKMTPSADIA